MRLQKADSPTFSFFLPSPNLSQTLHLPVMAILTEEGNEYEVRIKRTHNNTYFKEYVKSGDREDQDATSIDRYIVGESGTKYSVEVTLKEGFKFAPYEEVYAAMFISGVGRSLCDEEINDPAPKYKYTDEDIHLNLAVVSNQSYYPSLFGRPFVFRSLDIGKWN